MTVPSVNEPALTPLPVRQLSAEDLGVVVEETPAVAEVEDQLAQIEPLSDDDPLLEDAKKLLEEFGGVIFTGPPGTSKSWYAARIGAHLAERDPNRLRFLQFHPSYQYEDFVEGFVPKDDGSGFVLTKKHLLEMCDVATRDYPGLPVVIVIDELSRGEPGRIFGEALTYVEKTKRGLSFRLASGGKCSIPENLIFLATMNPNDRGVDEVDAAFERRFGKIRMDPQVEQVSVFLSQADMPDDLRARVEAFFRSVMKKAETNPFASLGHTYFAGKGSLDDLRSLWEHQLSFHFEKAYRMDPGGLSQVRQDWDKVMQVESIEDAPTDATED